MADVSVTEIDCHGDIEKRNLKIKGEIHTFLHTVK